MTWLVVLTLAATPTIEQQASSLVRERFETAGRSPPVDDARLGLAARSLAKLRSSSPRATPRACWR